MKWAPMHRFAERYEKYLPNYEWKPLFGFGRWACFVVRKKR